MYMYSSSNECSCFSIEVDNPITHPMQLAHSPNRNYACEPKTFKNI
jgi:hypothetical protein